MRRGAMVLGLVLAGGAGALSAQVVDLDRVTMVDLTHSYNAATPYWPNSPFGFRLDSLSYGRTPGGWFYSSFAFSAPEHGGTHLDAPIHFHEGGLTADRVPLERLIAPAVVIDVAVKAQEDRDFRLSRDDVLGFERRYGKIAAGTIVLLRTGWDRFYDDRKAYFGDDTPGDVSHLSFPSYGEDAARLLVEERGAIGLGVDTPSIDYGRSTDFRVHQVAAGRNAIGLENLTGLDGLPPVGAVLFALPMKIEGGSGGPLRAVALVPKRR